MNTNINHLKYFFDTVHLKSANKAAKLNFVSQPAISQGIRKLEEQTGLKLLEHKRNRIAPTIEGINLYKYSKELFASIESLESKIDRLKGSVSGALRVACSGSIAKNFLIPNLKKIEKLYPELDLQIRFGKTNDQLQMLQNNEVDLGITLDNGQLENLSKKILQKGTFVLAGKKDSPKRFFATESRPEVKEFKKSLQKTGLNLDPLEVESWDLLYAMAKNNLGYSLLPDFLLSHKTNLVNFNKKFKVAKIEYSLVSFYDPSKKNNLLLTSFLDYLEKTMEH